jgi:uroporphyrinogen decarboxylase
MSEQGEKGAGGGPPGMGEQRGSAPKAPPAGLSRRERVRLAIGHREADRVPKGELCVEAELANRLLGKRYPLDYQHYQRDREVRELLNMDLINLGDWPAEEIGLDAEGNRVFRSVYGYEYSWSGLSRRILRPPIADIAEAHRYRVPDIRKVSGELIARFARETDFFVMAQIGGPVSMLDEMLPMEDFLVCSVQNTAQMRLLAERVMEFELAKARLFMDSGAEAVLIADDIAFNSGPFLPPAVMEELVFPFYREAVAEIKRHREVPVFLHSDGDLRPVLERIVESGFDGLHSLQPSAGMEIAEIKRRYGPRLCLMGNIDLNQVLTFAPPEEVAEVVRRTIEVAAPGGGFILSSCNTLINAIPPENALAMYRTADRYGGRGALSS